MSRQGTPRWTPNCKSAAAAWDLVRPNVPLFDQFNKIGLSPDHKDRDKTKVEAEKRRQEKRAAERDASPEPAEEGRQAKKVKFSPVKATQDEATASDNDTSDAVPIAKVPSAGKQEVAKATPKKVAVDEGSSASKQVAKATPKKDKGSKPGTSKQVAKEVVVDKGGSKQELDSLIKYCKDGTINKLSLKGGILEPFSVIVCGNGNSEAYIRGKAIWLYSEEACTPVETFSDLNPSDLYQAKGTVYAAWDAAGKAIKIPDAYKTTLVLVYTGEKEIKPKLSEMVGLTVVNFKTSKPFRIQAVDKKTGSITVAPSWMSASSASNWLDAQYTVKSPVFERRLHTMEYTLVELLAVWEKLKWA